MGDDGESKNKNVKAKKWEKEAIGCFLLELHHQMLITRRTDYLVPKNTLKEKFQIFLKRQENVNLEKKWKDSNESFKLGTILWRTNYLDYKKLKNKKSEYFAIRETTLNQYRNEQFNKWDKSCRNRDNSVDDVCDKMENNDIEKKYLKVAEDAPSYPLVYQGYSNSSYYGHFSLSTMGCFICQLNFEDYEDYEEHVQWHGDESDFKSLLSYQKRKNSYLKISYQMCKDSHFNCFTISSDEPNVIIDKIILVQSRSMLYLNDSRMPHELIKSRNDTFFIDSHLLTLHVEQPIVVVFHFKSIKTECIVEQHHFFRRNEFSNINFSINKNRLPNNVKFKATLELPQFLPPANIKTAVQAKFSDHAFSQLSPYLGSYIRNNRNFTTQCMTHVLKVLLQIEDMEELSKYSSLVQHNVKFRQFSGKEFSFTLLTKEDIIVENILTPFDKVIFIPDTDHNYKISTDLLLKDREDFQRNFIGKKCHYGKVEDVDRNRVTVTLRKLPSIMESYNIIFRPMRLLLRYQYQALKNLDALTSLDRNRLFFPESCIDRYVSQKSLVLFQNSIAKNTEQLQAVHNIASGPKIHAPYIIFGPPGTGKTTTVVEAILQLYLQKDKKILVTAGSNGACDEVALRLCQLLEKQDDNRAIVRIFAKSNEKRLDSIDNDLLEASNMYGEHFYPDINVLHTYRIIVCTLSVVGKLTTGNFGRGVFTHIFVDEVAASTEAETLVGVVGAITPHTRLIISGDHKQLGPILQSERAYELGLGVSLLERLLKRPCYRVDEQGQYDQSIQTRLRQNFRSHSEIVNLYSELYYDGELMPMANNDDVNWGEKWHHSPNPKFPIIFHSVFGKSERGKNSVSLYNDKELDVVMDYVKDLIVYGIAGEPIEQSDIGIISPYKKQYLRIREELNLRKLFKIETGSVETFQGKEKHVIIVSFVRSFTSTLGFLDSQRRLNVTLSRAKSLMILVGNPKTLSVNEDFRHIIEQCTSMKTMVGANNDEQPEFGRHNRKNKMEVKKQNVKPNNSSNSNKDQKNTTNNLVKPQPREEMTTRLNSTSIENQRKRETSTASINCRISQLNTTINVERTLNELYQYNYNYTTPEPNFNSYFSEKRDIKAEKKKTNKSCVIL